MNLMRDEKDDQYKGRYTGALDAGYFDFSAADAEMEKAEAQMERAEEERKQRQGGASARSAINAMSWEFSRPFMEEESTEFEYDRAAGACRHLRPGGDGRDWEERHRRRS